MKHGKEALFNAVAILFLCILLNACGGGSGSKAELPADAPPVALAEVIGAINNSQVKVRSGSDVLLSGQNSKGVDDPILNYQWAQIDNSGFKVELYERAKNSVAFTAPDVPTGENVALRFRLTVTDADGVNAHNDIDLVVQSVKDANHFLAIPSAENKFIAYIAATQGSVIANNIDAVLLVKATATWMGRDGNKHQTDIMTKRLSATVPVGMAGVFNHPDNPAFTIDLPELNQDQINKSLKGDARLTRLEFEHLQDASINLSFELQQSGGVPLNVYLADASGEKLINFDPTNTNEQTQATNTTPFISAGTRTASLDLDELRQALNLESKRSANNYYQCIDPQGKAKTFASWLANAGFTGKDDGDVNTKYINNYDLGFGRDMHMRQDEKGNVYSYVTNYVTLENTLGNRNEFAIVAMEYSSAPQGNCGDIPDSGQTSLTAQPETKIVKFYTFIPDQRNGGYMRSESMNFDGRGEKYVPGVCTACHYGNNHTAEFNSLEKIAASNADLNSSFMPWDLDAFLYTNASNPKFVDPTYAAHAKASAIPDAERNKYSREAQEAAFKKQNQMVLHTFTQNPKNIPRFTHAITQLHGWYGNSSERTSVEALHFGGDSRTISDTDLQSLQARLKTLPTGSFDGSYIPKGWRGDKSQEALYADVYERNCRMCHLFTPNVKFDFDSYNEFVSHPFIKNYVFERGLMPMSRLTMDRFWSDFNGGKSSAEKLREHLNSDAVAGNDMAGDAVPGKPVAIILPGAKPKDSADITLDFDENVILDSASSLFASNYMWKVNNLPQAAQPKLLFKAGIPGTTTQVLLEVKNDAGVQSIDSRRIFTNNYKASASLITTPAIKEGGRQLVNIFSQLCPAANADSKQCRAQLGDIKSGEVPVIKIDEQVANGSAKVLDAGKGIVEFTSTQPHQKGLGSFAFRLVDSFAEQSDVIKVEIPVESYPPPITSLHKCTVPAFSSANENCENPASSDIPAQGLSLTVVDVDSHSRQGGFVSFSNGILRYTPPAFFVGTDNFKYRVRDNSLSQTIVEGSFEVVVVPVNVYSNVQNQLPSPLLNVIEGGKGTVNVFSALCPNNVVDSIECRSVFGTIRQSEIPQIQLTAYHANGTAKIIDATQGIIEFTSSALRTAGNGEFGFSLTDSFGQSTGEIRAVVKINSLPAPTIGGPDICTISARTTINYNAFPVGFNNSSCPDPIANDSAATGLSIALDSVQTVSTKGGQVSINNGVIFYTPPANYVGVDSFTYRVKDNSFARSTSEGSITVNINAKTSFAFISASINTTCPTCHRANTTAFGPNWRVYSTFVSHAGGLGSPFMAYACGDPNHLGENRLCNDDLGGVAPTSIDQLNSFGQTILTWIEEGALNN